MHLGAPPTSGTPIVTSYHTSSVKHYYGDHQLLGQQTGNYYLEGHRFHELAWTFPELNALVEPSSYTHPISQLINILHSSQTT